MTTDRDRMIAEWKILSKQMDSAQPGSNEESNIVADLQANEKRLGAATVEKLIDSEL